MNRTIVGRTLGKTKKMLAGMYRQDLRSGDISIYYNDEKLQYEEPEIYTEEANGVKKIWSKLIEFSVNHNNRTYFAKGNIAIKKKAKVNEGGLTLLKNGRVIIGGFDNNYRPEEIFGKSNSFESQRIFGEIHLDDWPVVQTKDNFDWKNGLEDLFIDEVKSLADEYIKKSRKIRLRPPVINTSLSLQNTVKDFENKGIISEAKISNIKIKPESINSNEEASMADIEDTLISDLEDYIILDDYKPKSVNFKIDGVEYIFNLTIETENEDENWISIENFDNQYSIKWNIRHVFFRRFMDNPEFVQVMQNFIFAYSIAEVKTLSISEEGLIGPASLRNMINGILKKVGE